MPTTYFFPDTTVPINFAVIGRLDLLKIYLSGRGRVTQAVRAEVKKSSEHGPNLIGLDVVEQFGDPIVLDSEPDIHAVQQMRLRFATGSDKPTSHLGESETLHLLRTRDEFRTSRFATEDRAAYEVAGALGVLRHNTMEVFQDLVGRAELSAEEAFELLVEIETSKHERTLIARPSRLQDLIV